MNSSIWFYLPIFKSDEFKLIEQQDDDVEQPDECVGNRDDADTFEINVSVRQMTKKENDENLFATTAKPIFHFFFPKNGSSIAMYVLGRWTVCSEAT